MNLYKQNTFPLKIDNYIALWQYNNIPVSYSFINIIKTK